MSLWHDISSLARLAPTPHNTQPFRLRPYDDGSADMLAVTERLLPRGDRGNRYMASSFGIFAETVRRAGEHFGHRVVVEPRADLDVATLHSHGPVVSLGTARVEGAIPARDAESLLTARRTSRLPYHDRVVGSGSIKAFEQMACARGHRFMATSNRKLVRETLHLNAHAVIDNLQLNDERRELSRWMRYAPAPASGDGLWPVPMNQPAWELRSAFALPRMYDFPGFRQFAVHRYLRTQAGTRHVGLLCGAFDTWPELIAAGELLLELWIEMARRDVYMQPMGSMLTNPKYADDIARRFGVADCWLIFRFGYSDEPPRAPRLETILI